MELFKLFGTIEVDNSKANQALDDTGNMGEQTQSKLSKAFSAVGKGAVAVGKTIATGMAAGAVAVGTLVTKSVQSYAEYEQLVGGVETLFKGSASKVQGYAENAYKTAGLSANDYMDTVTSFAASLLQSVGNDTEAAAEKADMAITDMSDNANKMGTDMASIQTAYQGFAKQNYTMLDNLKLGYGGTKEEMERLLADAQAISGVEYDVSSYADIVDAIHVIQTEMGITGTTAKEASTTISGSIASMKASWQNLLTAISADDLPFDDYVNNFVDSVSTVCDNVLPRVEIALNGVVSLINALAPQIIGAVPKLLTTLLPSVVSATTSIIQAVASALPGIVTVIVNCIPDIISAVETIFNTIVEALPGLIQSVASALPSLAGELVSGIMSMITTVVSNFDEIITPIIEAIPQIIVSIVNALVENLPALIEGCINMIMGIVEALPEIIQALVDALPTIITLVIDALVENIPLLVEGCIQLVMGIVEALPQIIQALCEALPTIISAIVDGLIECIPMLIEAGGQLLKGLFEGMLELITEIPGILADIGSAIIDGIKALFGIHSPSTVMSGIGKDIMQGLINGVKSLFSSVSGLWTSLKETAIEKFNQLKDKAGQIWDNVKTAASEKWSSIKDTISEKATSAKEKASSAWESMKSKTSEVFSNLKSAASEKWSSIKQTISDKASSAKESASNAWSTLKSNTSSAFDSLKSKTSDAWETIKSKIKNPIESARDAVKSAIDKMKSFFDFSWELPKIKLPHFSISGKFSLNPPSIPHFSVEWYKQAMENPMVMSSPTIFGYNPESGNFMGGGEAGDEVLSGKDTLMSMIRSAVAGQNDTLTYYLQKLIEILSDYFPQVIDGMERPIAFDTNGMVKALAGPMDQELGRISAMKGRGR